MIVNNKNVNNWVNSLIVITKNKKMVNNWVNSQIKLINNWVNS